MTSDNVENFILRVELYQGIEMCEGKMVQLLGLSFLFRIYGGRWIIERFGFGIGKNKKKVRIELEFELGLEYSHLDLYNHASCH